jgi:tetratricopeptide (TPR) repeat protein
MKCPVCRATYKKESLPPAIADLQNLQISSTPDLPSSPLPNAPIFPCRRCGADLAPLIQIRDHAIWHYRRAIQFLQSGDLIVAQLQVQQAIALHSDNADFHALAGQLWAIQGDFQRAAIAWKQAQHLDAKHPLATPCLQIMAELR